MQPGGGSPYPPTWAPYPVPGWARQPPPPRPRGIPSVSAFTTGAIGNFLAAGTALPFAFFVLEFGFGFGFGFFSFFVLSTTITMSIALILQLFGFFGFWRNYGSRLGAAAFAFGLVATSLLLTVVGLAFVLQNPFQPIGFFIGLLLIAAYVLVGVMFILEGSAFLVVRHYSLPGASIAAAVLFIIAGGLICSFILAPVGGIVTMPAFIVGGIVLVKAPVPMVYARPADIPAAGPPPPVPP